MRKIINTKYLLNRLVHADTHAHTHTGGCMCAPSNQTILNDQPLYLGSLLYFANPEPGALWQGLGSVSPYNLTLYILHKNAQQ